MYMYMYMYIYMYKYIHTYIRTYIRTHALRSICTPQSPLQRRPYITCILCIPKLEAPRRKPPIGAPIPLAPCKTPLGSPPGRAAACPYGIHEPSHSAVVTVDTNLRAVLRLFPPPPDRAPRPLLPHRRHTWESGARQRLCEPKLNAMISRASQRVAAPCVCVCIYIIYTYIINTRARAHTHTHTHTHTHALTRTHTHTSVSQQRKQSFSHLL